MLLLLLSMWPTLVVGVVEWKRLRPRVVGRHKLEVRGAILVMPPCQGSAVQRVELVEGRLDLRLLRLHV